MAEKIEYARIWTKVDTLENWNANPLLLGPGEMALVTTPSGAPMNMKWGDKTTRKRFSDLPFAIAYDQGQFVAVSGTVLPASDGTVHYSLVGEGTYTRAGQANVVVPTGKIGVIVDDGTTWILSSSVTIPTADTSSFLKKSDLKSNSLIQIDSAYIKKDTVIASAGNAATNPTTYAGAVSIVDFPLQPNKTYTLGGFLASAGKTFALADSSGAVVQVGVLATLPKVFTTDSTHYFLRAYIKQRDVEEATDNWSKTLMLNEGSVLFDRVISKILTESLEAKNLSSGNIVPNPVTDLNAVNKGYFDLNAIKDSDLVIERSLNLADKSKIITGKYIGSSGTIASVAGWKMIPIDVSGIADGAKITFGRFTIQDGGYSAFHNSSGLVQNNGGYDNGTLPRTVIKPAGATILYIDIARPTGTNNNDSITVNLGNVLIDYVPYGKIKAIKGYDIEGSSGPIPPSYDQSLNTTDSVQFAKVTAGELSTSVLVANLPTSPAGLPTGRAWVDEANGKVIKVV